MYQIHIMWGFGIKLASKARSYRKKTHNLYKLKSLSCVSHSNTINVFEVGFTLCFSSSQHVDIAALLIKYNTCVNATDKWAFTPLHEAAQKGRTQLCALLLAHGADPTMKNQEGQTALDLATVRPRVRHFYMSIILLVFFDWSLKALL